MATRTLLLRDEPSCLLPNVYSSKTITTKLAADNFAALHEVEVTISVKLMDILSRLAGKIPFHVKVPFISEMLRFYLRFQTWPPHYPRKEKGRGNIRAQSWMLDFTVICREKQSPGRRVLFCITSETNGFTGLDLTERIMDFQLSQCFPGNSCRKKPIPSHLF